MINVTPDFIFINSTDSKLKTLDGVKTSKGWRFPNNFWCLRELESKLPELANNTKFVYALDDATSDYFGHLAVKDKDTNISPKLREYQRKDLNYLMRMQCAGIFNEPRTGKTPLTIELVKHSRVNRTLIICPASLIWNWHKEFGIWYPEEKVTVVSGTPAKRHTIYNDYKEGVLIISKDTLKADVKNYLSKFKFDICAVDEAHFLRNYDSKQSKAILEINAERRFALSGTPTVKHASDIYGIFKFLYPKKFPSYWQFVDRYFDKFENYMGFMEVGSAKKHRLQELQEMTGIYSVQRKRKDVMAWLPDKQRIDIPIVMNTKQEKLYKQMEKEFVAELDDVVVDSENALSKLMRLRQLSIDPRLLGFDVIGEKTLAIREYLDDNKEPIVIMSMFTSYLKLLATELKDKKIGMIIGETSQKDKQKAVEDFQKGKIDILLCNILSAGVGFTLDKAETIIFTDKAWNPADNDQAEDRITPVSKERNHKHDIITFESVDSVDKRINELLKNKKSLTDLINEGGMIAIKNLINGRV